MKLVIGLGNPGEEYKKTRHNAGFLAVDELVLSSKYPSNLAGKQILSTQSKFNAEISQGTMNNEKVILVKPLTFMNNSGQAVRAVLDYYKINTEDIIVIHDDLGILLGKYKISKNKNFGGHKGVQSIIDYLGTKDFTRIRIGIMIENKKTPTEKFVLERFNEEEMEIVDKVIAEIIKNISTQL
ncbi:MAG: aminoacyl-tRNA hydrolase [Patescibacteria group bacterium]|nr:aminoacyl-tRNA hydrolase [Patescibacteria group bacterium]